MLEKQDLTATASTTILELLRLPVTTVKVSLDLLESGKLDCDVESSQRLLQATAAQLERLQQTVSVIQNVLQSPENLTQVNSRFHL